VRVLAWLIDAFGEARPITSNGQTFREVPHTVLHPDGTVDDCMGQHPSLESWLSEQRAAGAEQAS